MGAHIKGRSARPLTSVCQLTESHSHAAEGPTALAAPRKNLSLRWGLGGQLGTHSLMYMEALIHLPAPRFNPSS